MDIFATYIIVSLLWVPGFFANSFIIVNNVIQFHLKINFQSIDIIMTSICLGNLIAGTLNVAVIILPTLNICPHVVLVFLWGVCEELQKWGITLICVFFYFRVVPHKSSVCLWLNSRFSVVVLTVLFAGCVCSLTTNLIDLLWEVNSRGTLQHQPGNCSYASLPKNLLQVKEAFKILSYCGVISLMAFSSGRLMIHLCTHMRRMQGGESEMSQVSQDGVSRAAHMILLLALVFVAYATTRFALAISAGYVITENSMFNFSFANLTLSTVIPITLIAGISTLRQKLTSLWCTIVRKET